MPGGQESDVQARERCCCTRKLCHEDRNRRRFVGGPSFRRRRWGEAALEYVVRGAHSSCLASGLVLFLIHCLIPSVQTINPLSSWHLMQVPKPMFKIAATSKAGYTWIALRDIPPDTIIFEEVSLFRLPLGLLEDDRVVEAVLENLDQEDRVEFHSLQGRDLCDKLLKNHIPLPEIGDKVGLDLRSEIGVFLKCARINHSCMPNAVRVHHDQDKYDLIKVMSTDHIKKGKEITISYLDDNFQTAASRLLELRDKIRDPDGLFDWRDGCQCQVCQASDEEVAAGDAVRLELRELRGRFIQDPNQNNLDALISRMAHCRMVHTFMGVEAMTLMKRITERDKQYGAVAAQYSGDCFQPGTKVKLMNLSEHPQLDGLVGTVYEEFDPQTQRLIVELQGKRTRSRIKVHPTNCFLVRQD